MISIVGNTIVKVGDTIELTVFLADCPDATSYGITVVNSDKLVIIEGIVKNDDGISVFDLETKRGAYASIKKTGMNGKILTLTIKASEATGDIQNISVQVIVKDDSTELCNQTQNVNVKVICDIHSYGDWLETKAPTCADKGIAARVCSVCHEEETKEIEATGIHTFDNDDDNTCNVCGYEKYVPGDLDGNKKTTDSDAVYLLFHTYFPEDYPIGQPVDYDGDGSVTDKDAVYLLLYTYFPEDYPLYATTPAMTVMETIETKKDEE